MDRTQTDLLDLTSLKETGSQVELNGSTVLQVLNTLQSEGIPLDQVRLTGWEEGVLQIYMADAPPYGSNRSYKFKY
jgi:hypothetical protein